MKSHTTARFWKFYNRLPVEVQRSADAAYRLWHIDPRHPGLRFKRVDAEEWTPVYALIWLSGNRRG